MRVFISHSSRDEAAVLELAEGLRGRGFEVWLDRWEIRGGDDVVAAINRGLADAEAGIVVFSPAAGESRWVSAEVSYLTWARIEEDKAVIPVMAGDGTAGAEVPPLLRPLMRLRIDDVEAIAAALRSRTGARKRAVPAEQGRTERVVIGLHRGDGGGFRVGVTIRGTEYAHESHEELPPAVVAGRALFLRGFRAGLRRDAAAVEALDRRKLEEGLADFGRALGELCLPGQAAEALTELVDGGAPVGVTVEVCFETGDRELLGLPFEALRLPDGRLLATLDPVVVLRRPAGVPAIDRPPLAGPLKTLVAVAAPDEGLTPSVVLDQESELQNILDAVEEAQRRESFQVRFLEVGHPKEIGKAIQTDAYHVLHLSCHGSPGTLELESELGEPVKTTAEELLAPIKAAGRPLPLVFLNACHGGVEGKPTAEEQTASLAEALLGGGVPCVVAMQTSVSDHHAIGLARSFYQHLARSEPPRASRALARARRELERARRKRVQEDGAPLAETQPEYATATLFVAGEEPALADYSLDKKPLRRRPVHHLGGPVPQLRVDDLVGRRQELRQTLRVLRDGSGAGAGVVLTGIGGVGKSAVAGRAMQRLAEEDRLVPAVVGRLDLRQIARVVGLALRESGRAGLAERAAMLLDPRLDELDGLALVANTLSEEDVVLVLDDFEQNLVTGGGTFHDADVAGYLGTLAAGARRGRLLITCRHPVPGLEAHFEEVAIGPLSDAQSRKLMLRLDSLKERPPEELVQIRRTLGGHPRMLEILDGLLRGGEGRLPKVTERLQELMEAEGLDPKAKVAELQEGLEQTILLGARDVVLEELLELAREEEIDEVVLQAAVSNLPIAPSGLAHALSGEPQADPAPVKAALERLAALSLVHRFPDGSVWVHRWTAEGLAELSDEAEHRARCVRAGQYRWWRVGKESHTLDDAVEALRNFLTGGDFDNGTNVARHCFEALKRFRQSAGIAALASEMLETLPPDHPNYAPVMDAEAQAHLALGRTDRALERYQVLLNAHERRAAQSPDRADYQRDLSVSYQRMGNLYRSLGQGEAARAAYQSSLEIAERLASAEPDRADYQRDLSVSYNKMGDLYRSLGQGEQAREAYQKDLEIAERLASSEPDRADYQRDLSVSCERMGNLYRSLGQGEQARKAYQRSLEIAERLASAEPDRADYQRDLGASYQRMGDLATAMGQTERAKEAYEKLVTIFERLVSAEPDRADYQRDLSVSYERMGDLYRSLGQGEPARQAYQRSLEIRERLASSEPDRADYQRELAVPYERMGEVYRNADDAANAIAQYDQALRLREQLAAAEPDRADYQVELAVTLTLSATLDASVARERLERALSMLTRLQTDGRLAPEHESKIKVIQEMLKALRD